MMQPAFTLVREWSNGPFSIVGYRLPDGSYLENTQLEPDVKVANNPETVVKGEDTQLKMAVDELLKEIDSQKK